MNTDTDLETFRQDVLEGMRSPHRSIPSKYFYDAEGDAIFQEIMALDEYYLTRSELEILSERSEEIIGVIGAEPFDVIELGAGDGSKTKVFLERVMEAGCEINYMPVDISPNVLSILKERMAAELPSLTIQPQTGEYLAALQDVEPAAPRRVLMFMGSTLGNFSKSDARSFVRDLSSYLQGGDWFMLGIDLKKDPRRILAAYNDEKGVTRRFNLNLLKRINRELEGDFDVSAFRHYPTYDPDSGMAASYLVSTKDQTVRIGDESFFLEEGSSIHTEVSMKYDRGEIELLGRAASLDCVRMLTDTRKNYCIALFRKHHRA